MKKSRFATEQIIGFIKQVEAGMAVPELAHQYGLGTWGWRLMEFLLSGR